MDETLRRSAAHVLVDDVDAPVLDDASQHHVRRVLRLRDGEAVTVTDGAGRWRPCAPGRATRSRQPATSSTVAAPVSPVTIAVALPKGDRLDWLVQKCTEIGVDRIVLVEAERSVVRWDAERAERQLDRLRRIAVEAALQSRRVWFPELDGPVPAADGARRAASSPSPVGGRSNRTIARWPSVRRAAGRRPSWRWPAIRCRSATPCCASRPRPSSPRALTGRPRRSVARIRRLTPDRVDRRRTGAVRGVRARPVLRPPLRLLRLRHVDRSWPPRRRLPRRRADRDRAGRRRRDAGRRQRVRRRRDADARPRRRAGGGAAGDPGRRRRRGHRRVQPRRRHRGDARDVRRGRCHAGVDRRAVDGAARARRARPYARPGERRDRRRGRPFGRCCRRSTSTSSTARWGSSSPTGGPRWSARSTSSRRTSRPTR